MANVVSAVASDELGQAPRFRQTSDRLLQGGIEAGVLVLVCLSPWALGAAEPTPEFFLLADLGLLLALWAARVLLRGRLTWTRCPVALCLAGLFLLAAWQLVPLPAGLLARLSPGTAELYQRLLPDRPELLPGEAEPPPGRSAGATLSLYPHATRRQALQLLAVLLAFALVRNNLEPAGGLRRLARAALAGGALLAVFALVQSFTAPDDLLYWTLPVAKPVFGPFLSRDHFAAYVSLCIGLGVGLFLGRLATPGQRKTLLPDWGTLWTGSALVLMLGGAAFCLSPGGLLGLLGASICLLIQDTGSRRLSRPRIAFLAVAAAVLVLAAWLSWEWVGARSALGPAAAAQESRLGSWSRALRWVGDLPLWGTGFGTLSLIEPRQHGPADSAGFDAEDAGNAYVEALAEGGVVRLALSLVAIGLVFRLGWRAYRRHTGTPTGALALGGLFAFTTLVTQSAVSSALHVPAVVLLSAVLCAHLCGLGERQAVVAPGQEGGNTRQFCLRLWGLAPPAWTVLAVTLGLVLAVEGWKGRQVKKLQLVAARLDGAVGPARSIVLLSAAARLAPGDARLQMELAQAHVRLLAEQRARLKDRARFLEAAQAVLAFAPVAGPFATARPGWTPAPFWLVAPAIWEAVLGGAEGRLAQARGAELRHGLRARDACPLWAGPHLWIAEHADRLAHAETCSAYLERARFLAPDDPEVWYRCGIQEVADGHLDRAWESWRRCLDLSDLYLTGVLDRSATHLEQGDVLGRVLPDRPGILLAAAHHLFPEPEAAGERRPFLEKALALFAQQPGPLPAQDLHIKAVIHRSLGQPAEALATYEAALARAPHEVGWRYEFAELLHAQGRLRDTRRALRTLLEQEPGHRHARTLLDTLEGEIGEEE